MKKLGIISLVFRNYGTKLQSYALCRTIDRLAGDHIETEVIRIPTLWDTRTDIKKNLIKRSLKTYGIKAPFHILETARYILERRKIEQEDNSAELDKRIKEFERFDANIPYTRLYSLEEIRRGALRDYDAFLVGSDQVWNDLKVKNQDIYMLDFFKGEKKLTYAASFGQTTIPEEMLPWYGARIKNFSSLLLREDEGVEICRKLGREDATLVLDPTMLLGKEDYGKMLPEKKVVEGDYILVYSLNYSYKIFREASRLAKRNSCKMVILKRSFCPPRISRYDNAVELYAESPENFLSLIKNAKCVVTNSYHALLFSLIFNTDFYLYLDNADEENSRLLTMTRLCSLDSRVFWETGSLPKTINKIDYQETNEILARERKRSTDLLNKALSII